MAEERNKKKKEFYEKKERKKILHEKEKELQEKGRINEWIWIKRHQLGWKQNKPNFRNTAEFFFSSLHYNAYFNSLTDTRTTFARILKNWSYL